MRFVRQQLPPISVSTDVSLILSILGSDDELIPSELAVFTGLTPSQISRRLAKLEGANLISRTRGTGDARTVTVSFTPQGRKAIEEVRELNNQVVDLGTRPLDTEEMSYLESFFRNLMDQFGTKAFKSDPRERPILLQQRRLVRGMKMVGPNYFDTGIELSTYHVLIELDKVKEIRFKDLNAILPVSSSGLSRILGSLQSDDLVNRRVQKNNVKNVYFSLTKKGKEYFKRIEDKAARKMLGAIHAINETTINRAFAILEKCYSQPVLITAEVAHEIVRCTTKKQFFQARAFFVERLVEARKHTALPSSILPDEELCFLALRNNQVVGVLHAKESRRRQVTLIAIELLDKDSQVDNLLLEALVKAFPKHSINMRKEQS